MGCNLTMLFPVMVAAGWKQYVTAGFDDVAGCTYVGEIRGGYTTGCGICG